MDKVHEQHIVPYWVYGAVLAVLLLLTALSVLITQVELQELTVTAALLFATVKSSLVLIYFMHLKFDKPMFTFMVIFVLAVLLAVIIVTFLDYIYR